MKTDRIQYATETCERFADGLRRLADSLQSSSGVMKSIVARLNNARKEIEVAADGLRTLAMTDGGK